MVGDLAAALIVLSALAWLFVLGPVLVLLYAHGRQLKERRRRVHREYTER